MPCEHGSGNPNNPNSISDSLNLDATESELGIGPLGMVLVAFASLVGLALFLDPNSATYDVAIGGVIVLSLALGFGSGLQRFPAEYDIKKTILVGLIGASIISVMGMVVYATPAPSTIQGQYLLVLVLPTIFESLLFAGVFLIVRRVFGTKVALIVQAVFFAAYHFAKEPDPAYFIVLFAGGIIFMLCFLISRNLLSSMIAHAIANLRPVMFQLLLSPYFLVVVVIALLLILWRRFIG